MWCYVDARGGTVAEALAVCSRCGMGLCLAHAREVGVSAPKVPSGLWSAGSPMLILCDQCAALVKLPFDSETEADRESAGGARAGT